MRDGTMAFDARKRGTGVTSKEFLPGVRLVRAFNAINWDDLANQGNHQPERWAIPLASDDAEGLKVARATGARRGLRSSGRRRTGARARVRCRNEGVYAAADGEAAARGIGIEMRIRTVAAVAAFVFGSTAAAADRQDPHQLARDALQATRRDQDHRVRRWDRRPPPKPWRSGCARAGFAAEDVQVVGPGGRKQNLVARLKGTGRKRPVLLIGHLDVVEARREDWTVDPFVFLEKDGYFYGRGTQDMKDGVAIMTTTLLRYRAEGYRPDRDIILALTADEEGGTANGVDWLLKNRRDLVDAEFVLNHDGGGVTLENGRAVQVDLTASEKVLRGFRFSP